MKYLVNIGAEFIEEFDVEADNEEQAKDKAMAELNSICPNGTTNTWVVGVERMDDDNRN